MEVRILTSLSLLLLPLAVPQAQEIALEPEPAPRYVEPGPHWTGRYIVHVAMDAERHEAQMKLFGALRRAKQSDGLAEAVAAYEAELSVRQLPIAELARDFGAEVVGTTWIANTIALENVGDALIDALLSLDEVRLIQPDEWRSAQLGTATDAAHHNTDHANTLLAAGIPIKGDPITIGIVDSGVDGDHNGSGRPHAAFFPDGDPTNPTGPGLGGSRLLSMASYGLFGAPTPEDLCGHGTRMASIAAGAQFNALNDVDDGPAPNAMLRSYKISDAGVGECLASILSMDSAFQQILVDVDVTVANMSYDGSNDATFSPNPAIANAALADVVVTLSAGNQGSALSFAHGSYNALAVGASHVNTKQPLFLFGVATSAIGPLNGRTYPQILAVGENVTCAKMDAEASFENSTGTSASAAFVAGTAALVRQANPSLTALEVRAILLNTTDEVTLGNPNADGYGYLRADNAVQAALDGMVVQQTIVTGETRKHPAFLLEGDEATFTLAWFRESSGELTIDDLDLRVRDPQGNLIAWSASLHDNTEQIRITAASAGVYTVEVLGIQFDGDGIAEYALAGVDVEAFDPSTCAPGVPDVASQSPPAVPVMTQNYEWITGMTNQVTLTGCNFSGLTSLSVDGQTQSFIVIDDNTLTFNLGIASGVGALPMTLTGPGGSTNTALTVVPQNTLATTPTIDVGNMHLYVGGTPNHLFGVAFSPDLGPTVVPGLFSLDIGAGGASLYPVVFGTLNGNNGVEYFSFGGIQLPPSTKVHFQAATLDNVTLTPPWISTNPTTALNFP